MRRSPSGLSTIAQRAAVAAARAARLRRAARTLRRLASTMKFQPAAGQRPTPTPDLRDALAAIADVLGEVERGGGERGEDESALSSLGDTSARQIRFGHEAVEQGAQTAAAAVEVLRGVFASSDEATIDAPYGASAPGRHHPGALCTIVAERAEQLALALETVAIAKVNLAGAR